MAATALEVVSLERLKHELRLDVSFLDHDSMLTAQIATAVSFVEKAIAEPLVDVSETVRCKRVWPELPVRLNSSSVKSVARVRYWSTAVELRDDPDETIATGDLGRVENSYDNRRTSVWPPVDGWPEGLAGSFLLFDVVRGVENPPPALIQACVLCCRQLYDGYTAIRPTESFYALIAPWRRLG